MKEAANMLTFPEHISQPYAMFHGDPLRISAIFISTGDEVKSIGKLKIKPLFHIKKTEGISKFTEIFDFKRELYVRKKF